MVMRMMTFCTHCLEEVGFQNIHIESTIEVRDNARYVVTCPRGHSTLYLLQNQLYEVLFDIGGFAIQDGYYREAVSSFSSSLERFYEFSIHLFLLAAGRTNADFEKSWKIVAPMSERQLGAFVFLWTSTFGETPSVLTRTQAEFRNSVIHKGAIPARNQAVDYGKQVLELIRPKVLLLKDRFPKEIENVTFYNLERAKGENKERLRVATQAPPTILNLAMSEASYHQRPLDEWLGKWLKKWWEQN